MISLRPFLPVVLIVATMPSFAQAADCTAPPDQWLVGQWGMPHTQVTFRREGKEIVWEYVREAGVVTQRWGEKQPATAKGTVTRITGCEIEMKGKYTSFGGTQKAVGTPMQYLVVFDGAATLQGKGLGFGKEWFETRWMRAQ